MAYFTSIWKARTIEKCRQEYENEKINSLLTSKTEIPQKTIMQRWRFYGQNTKRRMTGRLRKWFPVGSSVSNLYFYLKSDHALPHFVLKSLIGFGCGIVLTYLCFIFFVCQLSISLIHATIMSSIIGVLLTLGLAFSCRIRCLIFLLIPQLFSRVGRYTLTCYALVLILTGPATNTLRNSEVLTESMACSQEHIKTNVRHITETVKKPFNAMKESLKLMVDGMKRVTSKINKIISKISIMVTSIADIIQSSYYWLNSVANICHRKFGTPYEHCLKSINRGVLNCKKTIGKDFALLCNDSSVYSTCSPVMSFKTICIASDYATTSFAATLKRRLRNYIARINTTFFINVQIHQIYSYSSNESNSPSQMAAGIVTEIRKRADPLLTWLSWSSCITSLFLLLIIFRAKYYQHMFETRSRFDNRYVTKELRDLDFKRYQERRETVLPLNRREQAKYISISSFRLVSSEKIYLTRSIIFMAITTFKLLIHMVADYSLYWVLITIRHHGRLQTPWSPGPSDAGVHVSGSGIVRDFIRSLLDSISSPLLPHRPNKIDCLPNPYPPDLQRYLQIAILIILLWFFALFEPYGLRFRHVIVGHYQPDRARTRAIWLYNHILRTRGSFMKFARRKLHREYKYLNHENQTFRYWMNSVLPCWFLRYIFGTLPKEPYCLLCKTFEEQNDFDTKLTNCDTLNCPGVYCLRCFTDICRLCTICLSPKDYGDMSDVSLEKGSSDDSGDTDDEPEPKQKGTERERLIKKPTSRKLNRWELSSGKNENENKELALVLPDVEECEHVNKTNESINHSLSCTFDRNENAIEKYKDMENNHPIKSNITTLDENIIKMYKVDVRKTSLDPSNDSNSSRNKNNIKKPVEKFKTKTNYRRLLHRNSKTDEHEKHNIIRNRIWHYFQHSQELGRFQLFNNIKSRARSIKVRKLKYQTKIPKYLKLHHKSKGRKSKSKRISNETNIYQKFNKISYAKSFTQSGYYIAVNKGSVSKCKRSRYNKNYKRSQEEPAKCNGCINKNINVFLNTCSNYYKTLKSITSSRKLHNNRNHNISVLSNKAQRKSTNIQLDNDETKKHSNPINRVCANLLNNDWLKVKFYKDIMKKVHKSPHPRELEDRRLKDVHTTAFTPHPKLICPFDTNSCQKTSETPDTVYKDSNCTELDKIMKDTVSVIEFFDVLKYDEATSEVNASFSTLSSFSLSDDDANSDTYTNSAVDRESPKRVQAMRRERKVKGDAINNTGTTSTRTKLSDVNATKNDWWSPILERTNVKERTRKNRVE